jgi:ElaB/YqjD/DUF883 family membrane-anchored ribosome-binding protein
MPARTAGFDETLTNAAGGVQEKLSDAAEQAKNKVSNLGTTAADKIDRNRESAASGLEKAASTLHEKANSMPGGEKVADFAHNTAERLNSTAEYVREHDVRRMLGDVEELVKKNPGPALISAAVLGFLIGRAFRDSD